MQEERLIELVRQNSFLYDKKHKDYRKHLKSENKWREIGAELNVSSDVVRKRWKTLKDRYHRLRNQKSSSSGNRKMKYRFFKMLNFLDVCNASNESTHDDIKDENAFEAFKEEFLEPAYQLNEMINNVPAKVIPDVDKERKIHLTVAEDVLVNSNNELVLSLLKRVKDEYKPLTKERGFCESLALQLEDAELPSENFRNFQIKVIQLLSDEISIVKTNNQLLN